MAEIEDLKIVGGSTYTVGNQDIIANEWEAGKTYVKGKSYVIREHRLYVCNVTHTSVEPFDATKWTEITIGDAIAGNTTAIGSLSTLTTTVKSSLVGAVNEVNGRTKPTTVTPTFNSSQSNYSIPFNNTRVYKMGNIVYFSSAIQADTPYGSSPGQEVYSGLPKPYTNDSIYMGFCAWNVTSNNMRVIVTSDGKLQCRGGNSGTAYDVSFSYVCQ